MVSEARRPLVKLIDKEEESSEDGVVHDNSLL